MFGGGSNTSVSKSESDPPKLDEISATKSPSGAADGPLDTSTGTGSSPSSPSHVAGGTVNFPDLHSGAGAEKRSGNGSPTESGSSPGGEKKRRSSGVGSKASSLFAQARNSLNFGHSGRNRSNSNNTNSSSGGNSNSNTNNNSNSSGPDSKETMMQKLGKQDPALAVPQGQHNNSAGESLPGPRSTFRVGVWEDKNKKCRRTMEDTHAFLYNFLPTPAPAYDGAATTAATTTAATTGPGTSKEKLGSADDDGGGGGHTAAGANRDILETDNGYFAIFDGHAGTFAADWCGKKLHVILQDTIRKHPNTPIPELLDMTFTTVDTQLEKLGSLKSSGCTAAIAVLRWEDRVPSDRSTTGSQAIGPAAAKAAAKATAAAATTADSPSPKTDGAAAGADDHASAPEALAKLKSAASRHRVLYTANVGDARIILCRSGKALRLSYDHKGSDENESKRISSAGGLILNNRVNGVLAVTRALGDAYMKDLVTGHPYTTETVIQPETDEFIIIACDGLWDVCSDQEAVDLVRDTQDPFAASKMLVDHALNRFSTDNLSCMIIRLDKSALMESQVSGGIGVDGDWSTPQPSGGQTETDKMVAEAKRKISAGETSGAAVSPTHSGRGVDSGQMADEAGFKPKLDGVGEEPAVAGGPGEDAESGEKK